MVLGIRGLLMHAQGPRTQRPRPPDVATPLSCAGVDTHINYPYPDLPLMERVAIARQLGIRKKKGGRAGHSEAISTAEADSLSAAMAGERYFVGFRRFHLVMFDSMIRRTRCEHTT